MTPSVPSAAAAGKLKESLLAGLQAAAAEAAG